MQVHAENKCVSADACLGKVYFCISDSHWERHKKSGMIPPFGGLFGILGDALGNPWGGGRGVSGWFGEGRDDLQAAFGSFRKVIAVHYCQWLFWDVLELYVGSWNNFS